MRRRVHDLFADKYGTAVEDLGRGKYRVEWDEPTPHQDIAQVPIPHKLFQWVEPAQSDGTGCG